jgi:membrane-associated protease RseP (regulator of RpoE activity)
MGLEEDTETKKKRIEFSFPMLMIKTQIFNRIFNKLGTFRASKIASWIALVLVPIIAAIGLYLILFSLITLISTPAASEFIGELGPTVFLFIPGINPMLPIFYGWIAIVCAMVIHEGAHGIAARSLGFRVKSSGLLFFLFIPIGAFVDVDEKQIEKSEPKRAIRVMAAGVGGNIVVAVACLIGILVIVGGLTPVIDGVYIGAVQEGLPAETAGLLPDDVFISINNIPINNYEDLRTILDPTIPGETIEVTVARGEFWDDQFSTSINLTEFEDRAIMGITNIIDLRTAERLATYQNITPQTLTLYLVMPTIAPAIVPYSEALSPFYTHEIGDQWSTIANILFWLWFVNVNLAVFNALPIGPLDGGRIFNITLKSALGKRFKEKTISQITSAVTLTLVFVIILMYLFPFIT